MEVLKIIPPPGVKIEVEQWEKTKDGIRGTWVELPCEPVKVVDMLLFRDGPYEIWKHGVTTFVVVTPLFDPVVCRTEMEAYQEVDRIRERRSLLK